MNLGATSGSADGFQVSVSSLTLVAGGIDKRRPDVLMFVHVHNSIPQTAR